MTYDFRLCGLEILGLYGAGMDPVVMQSFAYLGRHRHEIVVPGGQNVHRRDDLRFGELPDVQFVQ